MYIAIICLVVVAIVYSAPIVVEALRLSNRLPKSRTVEAKIVGMSNVVQLIPQVAQRPYPKTKYPQTAFRYCIDFELVSGEVITLDVSARDYKLLKAGDWGQLTYKKGSCKRFVKGADDTYVYHAA